MIQLDNSADGEDAEESSSKYQFQFVDHQVWLAACESLKDSTYDLDKRDRERDAVAEQSVNIDAKLKDLQARHAGEVCGLWEPGGTIEVS